MKKGFIKSNIMCCLILILLGILSWSLPDQLASQEKTPAGLKAGQEKAGRWWMKQTAMSADGKLASLKSKKWWKEALRLKTGESFLIPEEARLRTKCWSGLKVTGARTIIRLQLFSLGDR